MTTRPTFDVTFWARDVDKLLARTENPRHRKMLKNMRRHILLEMMGRADEVATPEMMSADKVFYRVAMQDGCYEVSGLEALKAFYGNFIAQGSLWSPDWENLMVNDDAVFGEAHLVGYSPGSVLLGRGTDVHGDPIEADRWYIDAFYLMFSFRYDADCLLTGEYSYDSGKHEIYPVAAEDVMTWEQAVPLLQPYLDNEPA